jgi:hypothetical protein
MIFHSQYRGKRAEISYSNFFLFFIKGGKFLNRQIWRYCVQPTIFFLSQGLCETLLLKSKLMVLSVAFIQLPDKEYMKKYIHLEISFIQLPEKEYMEKIFI